MVAGMAFTSASDKPESVGRQDVAGLGPAWEPGERAGVSLRTLVMVRWLLAGAEATAVVAVGMGLGFSVPYAWCLLLIAMSGLLNAFFALAGPLQRQAGPKEASLHIGFDILQISALLFVTGGALNPFAEVMIAPAALAAAILPRRLAVILCGVALAAIAVLTVWSMPLPWWPEQHLDQPLIYRVGSGIGLAAGLVLAAGYAGQAAAESARMELALNITRQVLAREQRLSALGGLAAAAAHELGTPLATIAVVARELAREAKDGAVREDAELLVSQTERCREILRRLTETPDTDDMVHARMGLLQLVHEVIEPHLDTPIRVEAVVTGAPGSHAPDIRRLPELLHAMTSLVENAVDFARSEVLVSARFDNASVVIEVRDDGKGFSPEILLRLGQPYVTSRPGGEDSRSGHIGMGLGFFIAKTLLERTGAHVDFRNSPAGGAVVSARWPRAAVEAPDPVAALNRLDDRAGATS
ncbi:sensor histidine kinase [Caulobacter sp. CCUG 60055]|nr:ActS/PrrB/RegB family redox-sensitive histidine kinase [Caulobacteraceae bacterium]MCI3180005.1 sensor histidine kinase [Caulobacter sp. CCUG 60055]